MLNFDIIAAYTRLYPGYDMPTGKVRPSVTQPITLPDLSCLRASRYLQGCSQEFQQGNAEYM